MARLYLYNTLHNERQLFSPLEIAHVRIYVCGPTVYGPVHIGNARPAVVFDLLYRLLKRYYPKVTYARNITDIDDKIIETAAKSGELPEKLADRWKQCYLENMRQLGVLTPDEEPTATAYIGEMIAMIERLLERQAAYINQGHVLFHVPAFPDYGALSNRRREDMLAGARVEVAPYKRDAADFVLWKPATNDEPGWDSPWGRGRPGWHIECSAMAASCLGKEIDIHGGGQDLIFPHHENELAQSRCANGTTQFAKFWLHNGHVRMDGEKMSKSLNNVLLLQDILAQYAGETVRLALFNTHYRRPLNWTSTLLDEARTILDKWYRILAGGEATKGGDVQPMEAALLDDLNTPAAIAELHRLAHKAQHAASAGEAACWRGRLRAGASLLGLLQQAPEEWFHQNGKQPLNAAAIEEKINQRLTAKRQRDFSTADAIRAELEQKGVLLEDSANGTAWRVK